MTISNESLINKGTFWLPESVTTVSDNVDSLFAFLIWLSFIVFVGLIGTGIYFLIKYRKTAANAKASGHLIHNTALEVSWTVIPLLICIFIFAWGYKDYLKLTVSPANAVEFHVTAKKWMWEFENPRTGAKSLNELVVPVNTPIKLIMTAEDVIHSFYVPNFRIKRDVIPNRYTRVWFEVTEVGNYQVFCTEYCGDGHSKMLASITVLSESDYEEWLANDDSGDDLPLEELGKKLYTAKACSTCHSLDGAAMAGPSWKGLYGKQRTFNNGTAGNADDNYIRESITNPAARVVKGYSPIMPTYSGLLTDREILGLIEYIKTIK
jgi:cytochrome c oxidase subunit II